MVQCTALATRGSQYRIGLWLYANDLGCEMRCGVRTCYRFDRDMYVDVSLSYDEMRVYRGEDRGGSGFVGFLSSGERSGEETTLKDHNVSKIKS